MQKVQSGCIELITELKLKNVIAKFKEKLMFLDVVENLQKQLGKQVSRIICIAKMKHLPLD